MNTFLGAAPEDLDALAGVFDAQASTLADVGGRVGAQISGVSWQGPDLTDFAGSWAATGMVGSRTCWRGVRSAWLSSWMRPCSASRGSGCSGSTSGRARIGTGRSEPDPPVHERVQDVGDV